MMNFQSDTCQRAVFYLFFWFSLVFLPLKAHAALDPARAAGLVPHKALYDIRLSARKSSANVADIKGTMLYEWQPSCDAWITNHRFDMRYDYIEVPPVHITSDFTTYEAFDGKSMNFALQRKRGGVVLEEIRGNAHTDESNSAIYSMPAGLEFDFPEGTLFPMTHTLSVLKEIQAGNKFYNVTMFDGSDTDGPVDVNSLVLEEAHYELPKEHIEDIDQTLLDSKSWDLRLAFFPRNTFSETADYEMSLVFHENGVVTDMVVDYSDFSVKQTLRALELLNDTCDLSDKGEQ